MRPSRTPTSTPAQRNRCSCERRATPSSSPPRRRHGSCGRRRRRYSGGGEQQNIAAAAPGHESPSPPTNPRQQCQTPIVVTVIQEPKITDLYLDAQGNTNQIQRFKDCHMMKDGSFSCRICWRRRSMCWTRWLAHTDPVRTPARARRV